MSFTIKSLWAFLSVDQEGEEGVIAFWSGDTWMPLIAADEARLGQLRELVSSMMPELRLRSSAVKLARFDARVDVEVIK